MVWCPARAAPPCADGARRSHLGEELPAKVRAIRARATEVAVTVPQGKPNTSLAIQCGAAALMIDPVAGRAFVHSLYRALWIDGAALTVTDGWQRTGLGGVPLLVRHDERHLYGLVDTDELRAFLATAPVDSGAMDTQQRARPWHAGHLAARP